MKNKYRAWDNINNKWVNENDLRNCLVSSLMDGDSTYQWNQTTGMGDELGREIYEGDLIQLWLSNYPFASGLFEVVFHRGAFSLYAHKVDGLAGIHFPTGKFMVGYDPKEEEVIWEEGIIHKYKPLGDFGPDCLEIVGNIFEHSYLIKN